MMLTSLTNHPKEKIFGYWRFIFTVNIRLKIISSFLNIPDFLLFLCLLIRLFIESFLFPFHYHLRYFILIIDSRIAKIRRSSVQTSTSINNFSSTSMLSRRAAASSDLALWMTHIIKLTPTIAFSFDESTWCVDGGERGKKRKNKLHQN